MINIDIIKACTDLGVCVDGSRLAPKFITENLSKKQINKIYTVEADSNIEKEKEADNKQKNLEPLNKFNEKLYSIVLKSIENGSIPITLGGDHSIAIATALASIAKNKNMGIIWIDAHGDYNTFDTTETGNIHGLPLAAITGYEKRNLTSFHKGNFYNYSNTVIVGGRDIDRLEKENLKNAGIKIFSTKDIHKMGMQNVMKEAFKIAANGTGGIHISYDIDVIDPKIAPGVSVPAKDGINLEEAYTAIDEIRKNKNLIKSLDLVEYNPLLDKEDATKQIAITMVEKFINTFLY